MKQIGLLIVCADKLRHKYFAIHLLKEFPYSGLIIESNIKGAAALKVPPKEISRHFEEFTKTEEIYFGKYVAKNQDLLKKRTLKEIPGHSINDQKGYIKSLDPKLIVLHGASTLKKEFVDAFKKKMINLHAGLPQYYQGRCGNLYPFLDKKPQYVGMTIHFADTGLGKGAIILQGRPELEMSDNTHTIGCKNVILGTNLIIKVIKKYQKEGELPSFSNVKKGKFHLGKNISNQTTIAIRNIIRQGLIKQYLKNPKDVDIVDW